MLTQQQMRIIFRICEYAQGLDSTIPNHEAYQYCLDSTPMLLALVVFNAVHPGRIMPGKASNWPSFMQRRRQRKQAKSRGVTVDYRSGFLDATADTSNEKV